MDVLNIVSAIAIYGLALLGACDLGEWIADYIRRNWIKGRWDCGD